MTFRSGLILIKINLSLIFKQKFILTLRALAGGFILPNAV